MGDFAQYMIGHAVKIREINYFSIARIDLSHLDYVHDIKTTVFKCQKNTKKTFKVKDHEGSKRTVTFTQKLFESPQKEQVTWKFVVLQRLCIKF